MYHCRTVVVVGVIVYLLPFTLCLLVISSVCFTCFFFFWWACFSFAFFFCLFFSMLRSSV